MRIPKIPTCPFCGKPIAKPTFLAIGFSDLEAGICECGSVYVCDVTGHNRGAAFVEALLIACAGDWELAWDLIPDEDYKEIWIENYDLKTHTILPESSYGKRLFRSALCFIKLSDDLRETREPKIKKLLQKEEPDLPKVEKRKLSKKELEELINQNNLNLLFSYILAEPLNLNVLQKFLYHPDPVFRKKVSVIIGLVSEKLVKFRPEKVLELLKRLIYSAADSASSAWGALEAAGEIIRNTKDRYSFFIKNLLAFIEFPEYRPYVLYAFYRISEKSPHLLKQHSYLKLLNYLEGASSEIQGLILLIFYNLKSPEIKSYFDKIDPEKSFKLFNYKTYNFETVFLKDLLKKF